MSTIVAAFEPTRLLAAVERAITLHPHCADAPPGLDPAELPALRRRVAAAAGDAAAVESLAAELTPREVRGLLTGLLVWEDLRTAVVALLELRLKPTHLPQLWTAWQRLPQLPELRALIERFDPSAWGFLNAPFQQLAPAWIAAVEAGVMIQAWLDEQKLTHPDLPRLGGAGILPDTPLTRLVHEAVLTHGSSDQLRREPVPVLVRLSREMDAGGKRLLFGRNYLVRIPVDRWAMPVLEEIRRSYGLPRRARLPRFWEGVPDELRDAFQLLFIERDLERAFGADSDRHLYWRRWTNRLDDVHSGSAGSTDYAILIFAGFGVVEFFVIGHAAYFYSRAEAEAYTRENHYSPASLKKIQASGVSWFGDNRLIHSGNWQPKADRTVRAYLRREHSR
jgi:hypothetical protein